ncbi:MAG: methyltransferase domain-containing protein [Gemmatimonadota bacterium]
MTLRRVRSDELMDRLDAEESELGRSLEDLERVNRWLGGRRSAVRLTLELAERVGAEPVTVLDIATGAADIPIRLLAEAGRRGVEVRVTATDLHPTTLAYAERATAGQPFIIVRKANALDLPFGDGEFDLVTMNTALHHFERPDAARVLREMARVARRGVVVTDLSRSGLALLGARVLAATAWRRHPITRHDGPASVRAAFTPAELADLASEVFVGRWRVRRHPVFRLSLVLDRTEQR